MKKKFRFTQLLWKQMDKNEPWFVHTSWEKHCWRVGICISSRAKNAPKLSGNKFFKIFIFLLFNLLKLKFHISIKLKKTFKLVLHSWLKVFHSKKSSFVLNDCCSGDENILQKHIEHLFDLKEDLPINKYVHYGMTFLPVFLSILDIIR